MEKVAKLESLQEIIAEMTETTRINHSRGPDSPLESLSARSDNERRLFCPGSGTEPAQPKQPGLESAFALQAAFADINMRKS